MNHFVIEVIAKTEPTVRYTQDNNTPVAELEAKFKGLRPDDQPGTLKVVGWGNIAQELKTSLSINDKAILEGRLRMNNVTRQDGTKEKKAELTLSKIHVLQKNTSNNNSTESTSSNEPTVRQNNNNSTKKLVPENISPSSWDSSPLIPDTDEIPF